MLHPPPPALGSGSKRTYAAGAGTVAAPGCGFTCTTPPSTHPPADTVLASNEAGRLITMGGPHVTGVASRCEPGGATFALDIRGTWEFETPTAAATDAAAGGTYHVPRLVSDPEFEGGVCQPVCVDVAADGEASGLPVAEAKDAIASAVTAAVAGLHQGVHKVAV